MSDTQDDMPDDPEYTTRPTHVELVCDDYGDGGTRFMLAPEPAPFGPTEQRAYATSGYTDNDISTLYSIRAEVDASDAYADPTSHC